MKKFYVTTPIYYVNDLPHIGHAYTSIAADVLIRYKKMYGYDTYFLTGTDEHGQKVEASAAEKGVTPKELADSVVVRFKELWNTLNVQYDQFIRTTDNQHYDAVKKIFEIIYEKGDIYKGEYEDWYCVPCETFLTALQLQKGCCPDCNRSVDKVSEEAYFFRLSKYGDKLLNHIEQNPGFIQPETRKNEIVSFIKSGLRDISISRTTIKWGIPLPVDERHIMYVWFDALTNYLSGIGYPDDTEKVDKLWPADVHIVGKDILRFHAVYWPAFLMAAGMELPTKLFSHGWWTVEGEKMSKSKYNAVDPTAIVNAYGLDPLRYFLLREIPFGQDGDFSVDAFISRNNHDLANDLGNLVNRAVAMVEKYFDGQIPSINIDSAVKDDLDLRVEELANILEGKVESRLEILDFMGLLKDVWGFVVFLNGYIQKTTPWALAKDMDKNQNRMETIFYHLLEGIRVAAFYLYPIMPDSSMKIFGQIGVENNEKLSVLDNGTFSCYTRFGKVDRTQIIFPKIEKEKMETEKNEEKVKAEPVEEGVAKIGYEDFLKVGLSTALILEAEKVPKSNKLLRLQVSLGDTKRQIVAGIGKSYTPEELVGKTVVVVDNLKPVKLMGVESNGMLLAAGDGKALSLLTTMNDVEAGSKIK